jgi:hypothetical protein
MRLGCGEIFVDQSAESVAATDAIDVDHVGERLLVCRRRHAERWSLLECAVRTVLVVMRDVRGEDMLEVTAADDQEPVETLATHGTDPALGVRARLRHPHRGLDHLDAFAAEDRIKLPGELAVAVADQDPRKRSAVVVELHKQIARLLSDPAAVRVGRDPGEMDPTRRELDEEQA